jgi:adenylylsulfate kinase
MKEKRRRSLMKAISWRILASLITVSLVFIFTGKIVLSLAVGITEVVVKMVFYFIHERIWSNIRWGIE